MKVLNITKDLSVFDISSSAYKEALESSKLIDQLHIIVLTTRKNKFKKINQDNKLFIYPTNSLTDLISIYDAYKIARKELVMAGGLGFDLINSEGVFETAIPSYLLGRKYKKNFSISIYENVFADINKGIKLFSDLRNWVALYLLPRAGGIRVGSQLIGEVIFARIPSLEDRIYILSKFKKDFVVQTDIPTIDIKPKYPQFNLFLLSVIEAGSSIDSKLLQALIKNLRIRYPRLGLIVIDPFKIYKPQKLNKNETPYIIVEKEVPDIVSYYKSVHILIDVSSGNSLGENIATAAYYGCPVVTGDSLIARNIIHEKENGFIADPNNIADFSGKIVQIFETPGLKEQMKLMSVGVEKLQPHTNEDYMSCLLDIWNTFTTKKVEVIPDKIEKYATNVVHTLKSTRNYAVKFSEEFNEMESKIIQEKSTPHRKFLDLSLQNQVLDVDAILKNGPVLPPPKKI